MKKGAVGKAKAEEEVVLSEVITPPVPQKGSGTFEYVNQTLYQGEWRLLEDGRKVKHGNGKITFAGANNARGDQ